MSKSILATGSSTEPIEIPGRDPVPVTLLTGFLGAGKTTLLNRILAGDHGLRVGVLVNDFGAVNIDAELIEGVEENTISLTNGCVCCEIRDDLITSLEQLLVRIDEIDYVILEASGIADPEGIVMTFLDQKYESLFRLDSITCVIDAESVITEREDPALAMLKLRQIGYADLVILNKSDLVSPEYFQMIVEWIGTHLNRVRIIPAIYCDVPLEVLLSVGRFDPATAISRAEEQAGDENDDSYRHLNLRDTLETWSYRSEIPFSIEELRAMVRTKLPASVYRCKGIVYTAELPGKRFALQTVGRRTEITELGDWDGRSPGTRIVAIGPSGQLDRLQLQDLFNGCLFDPALVQA